MNESAQSYTGRGSGLDYEALLSRCADKAYSFAYRLAGNDQDAQDLVQEAFTKAFVHRDRYDPSRPFEAWLKRILYNVYLDEVRRYEHKHKFSLDSTPPAGEDHHWEEILPGPNDPDPLAALMRREESGRTQEALNRLPVHYRTAVILFDVEEYSYEQIAEILDCPIGTVCSRIHQGRAKLKKILEQMRQEEWGKS